ncbi:hypothetical protein BH24PSE2_BH24PSE2_07270 [soil metagenome]
MPKQRALKPLWKRRWAMEDQAGIAFSPAFKKRWRKGDLFRRLCKRSAFQQEMDRDLDNFMTCEDSFMCFEANEWIGDYSVFSVYMAFMYGGCLLYSVGQEDPDALAKRAMTVRLFLFSDWKPRLCRELVEEFFAELPDDRFSAGIEEGQRAMQDWLAIASWKGAGRLEALMAGEVSKICSRLH